MTTRSWRYPILRALSLGLVACVGTLAAVEASEAATWSTTQVENSADVGKFASLAVDPNKKLHISYFDSTGKLKYATNKSGSWAVSTPVGSNVVAAGTAIAIDASTGNPQITYYYNQNTSNRGVRNIAFNGSTWGGATSINGAYVPGADQSTSIFNKDGVSHVTFVKNAGSIAALMYTRNTTAYNYSGWDSPVSLDSSGIAGTYNSIVVDSSGFIHTVEYNATTDLVYSSNTSGAWTSATLPSPQTTVGKYCRLTIDGSGNLHLTYIENTSDTPLTYRIMYRFKPAGGTWQDAEEVSNAGALGGYTSIAVDSNGAPYISYYYSNQAGTGMLRYATKQGGSWTIGDVDASSANVGQYSSIAIASEVSIAYYDVTNSALKVASLNPVSGSLGFGSVDRGFQSAPTNLTITNDAAATVTMGALAKSGVNADDFVVESDACSNMALAPQGTCLVTLRFAPPAAAPRSTARSASLSIPRSAPYATLVYSLSGATTANFLVTASATNGGSISPAKVAVVPNGAQSFSVSSDPGFSVESVVADGSVTLTAPYMLYNVTSDHTVLATLVSPIRVFESSIFYGSLQAAFASVNSGWTIQSQTDIPGGDLLVDRDIAVTLSGGYDSSFTSQASLTSVSGNIVISNGSLTVENVLIQ